MQVKYLTEAEYDRWDDYVDNHPGSKIYHKIAWKKIIEQAFEKKSLYFYVEQEGQIRGIMPLIKFSGFLTGKVLISLPFVNYGGMIYDNEKVRDAILAELQEVREREDADSVELRTSGYQQFELPERSNKITFLMDLPDSTDELMKQFKSKVRSQIRRPEKEEMYVKCGGSELLDGFYRIFCRNMRDLGTPVYGKKFFKTILNEIPDHSNIITVYTKNHLPVASAFIIGYGNIMEIPWASSLREYNRYSPNMLLYWEVMSEAIRQGRKIFDFGRGTKDGGTYRFKKQWGGEEVQLRWYYLLAEEAAMPELNKENPKYALAIRAWQKIPLSLANLIGPVIIKNIP